LKICQSGFSIITGLSISYLKVAQLSKVLVAVIQLALERLGLQMSSLVSPDVPALGKTLAALFAHVRPFTRVTSLVCL
jgi:hypothetical protein